MRATVATLSASVLIAAGLAPGTPVAFIGCPMVRDTPDVPCWLAQDKGRRFFLGAQADISSPFYPPQLGHQVLVEGVATARSACGGQVLEQVKLSVLKAPAPCQTILKAEGFHTPVGRHPVGPTHEAPGPRPPPELPPPPKPWKATAWTLYFDFDREFIALRNAIQLQQVLALAKAAQPATFTITGYRAATKLSEGRQYVEPEGVARRRAEQVAAFLRGLGAPTANLKVAWVEDAPPGDGERDWEGRRVTIEIVP